MDITRTKGVGPLEHAISKEDAQILLALSLEEKVDLTKQKIHEFVDVYGKDGVYISFSGGKDSTVLLHIARQIYPDIPAVYIDTGLEYPEIRQFAMSYDNVERLRPEMSFKDVVCTYGYPVISKEVSQAVKDAKIGLSRNDGTYQSAISKLYAIGKYAPKDGKKNSFEISKYKPLLDVDFNVSDLCCRVMKKSPAKQYEKRTGRKPILATLALESQLRMQRWIRFGCNAFGSTERGSRRRPSSNPLSFWTEQDVLQYIKDNGIAIASVYGNVMEKDCKLCTSGCDRTGCIFCAFGAQNRKDERFLRLKQTHPKQYAFCINGGGYDSDGLWKPTKEGLGMKHVFDVLNELYGDGFIKY